MMTTIDVHPESDSVVKVYYFPCDEQLGGRDGVGLYLRDDINGEAVVGMDPDQADALAAALTATAAEVRRRRGEPQPRRAVGVADMIDQAIAWHRDPAPHERTSADALSLLGAPARLAKIDGVVCAYVAGADVHVTVTRTDLSLTEAVFDAIDSFTDRLGLDLQVHLHGLSFKPRPEDHVVFYRSGEPLPLPGAVDREPTEGDARTGENADESGPSASITNGTGGER